MNKTWFAVTFVFLMAMNYAAIAVFNVSFNISDWKEGTRALHVILYPFCAISALIMGQFKDQYDDIPR